MARTPRSLEDCLMGDNGFARLSTQAARLLRMQRLFDSATPLARNARVANLRVEKVVIHAANGAVATKLKQIAPTLVGVFRYEAPEVTGIEVRVQPRQSHAPRGGAAPSSIAERQKRGLAALADGLPAESPLRAALNRLVARAK